MELLLPGATSANGNLGKLCVPVNVLLDQKRRAVGQALLAERL